MKMMNRWGKLRFQGAESKDKVENDLCKYIEILHNLESKEDEIIGLYFENLYDLVIVSCCLAKSNVHYIVIESDTRLQDLMKSKSIFTLLTDRGQETVENTCNKVFRHVEKLDENILEIKLETKVSKDVVESVSTYHNSLCKRLSAKEQSEVQVFVKGMPYTVLVDLTMACLKLNRNVLLETAYELVASERNCEIFVYQDMLKSETNRNQLIKPNYNVNIISDKPVLSYMSDMLDKTCFIIFYMGKSHRVLTVYEQEEKHEVQDKTMTLPIGKALGEDDLVILGKKKRKVLKGIVGEIFIKNYFDTQNEMSWTDTGCQGYYCSDGNIQMIYKFVQKADNGNIKLNLELLEELVSYNANVLEAKVLTMNKNREENTVVFMSVNTEEDKAIEAIKRKLVKYIPEYLLPQFYVMDMLPRNKVGSVDVAELKRIGKNKMLDGNSAEATDADSRKFIELLKDLLQCDRVPMNSKFFEIGGTSLLAIQLISRLNREFSTRLTLSTIFGCKTIRQLLDEVRGESQEVSYTAIKKAETKDYYDISEAQMQLWIQCQQKGAELIYNEASAYELNGDVDKEALKHAVLQLIARHEILRTIFTEVDYEVKQKVTSGFQAEQVFKFVDRTGQKINYRETLKQYKDRLYDLEHGPLIRTTLIQLSKEKSIFILETHHLVSDGWSDMIMFEDLITYYRAYLEQVEEPLEPLEIQYKDYVTWKNASLDEATMNIHKQYWEKHLGSEINTLDLPALSAQNLDSNYQGESISHILPKEIKIAIDKIVDKENAPLLAVIMSMFYVIFYKYTHNESMILGTVFAERERTELGRQVGLYISTVPIHVKIKKEEAFQNLVSQVKESILGAIEHKDFSYEHMLNELNIKRSGKGFFNIIIEVLNFDLFQTGDQVDERLGLPFGFEKINLDYGTTNSDMSIFLTESEDQYSLHIRYNQNMFALVQIELMFEHFNKLACLAGRDETTSIGSIHVISEYEKECFNQFNNSKLRYQFEQTVPQIIDRNSTRYPESVAIICNEHNITYHQLYVKSNQYAYFLRSIGIRENDIVVVIMERSIEMAEVILGIWKAGAAYLPIDPDYPYNRMKFIITDAKSKCIVFGKSVSKVASHLQWECPCVKNIVCADSKDLLHEHETVNQSMMPELWKYIVDRAENYIEAGMWYNSFNGKVFTKEEMDEYSVNAFEKLRPYLNKETKVLEIGCSSGITMFRVAPHVKQYIGVDMCSEVLEFDKKTIQEKKLNNIKLYCMEATLIDTIEENDFNIIILNSVVQNFSGYFYLQNVINKIISVAADKSIILFGDIMDLDRKEKLLHDIIEYRKDLSDADELVTVDWSQYLFIPQDYFSDLQGISPEIIQVKNSAKIHTIKNELTEYRYDTIITVDKSNTENRTYNRKKMYYDLNALSRINGEECVNYSALDSLAYIIYTSGSTGLPKGVMVEHKGMMNHMLAKQLDFGINKRDVIAQNASHTFDISAWQFFEALFTGGKTVICEKGILLDIEKFLSIIKENKVTILEVVPSYLSVILDYAEEEQYDFGELQYIVVTGEELPCSLAKRWFSLYPAIELVNAYGPTEASDDITHHIMTREPEGSRMPVGKPVSNMDIYIIDKEMNLCPLGVKGEICVSGIGVGRGYLNDEEKTKKSFVKNPFVHNSRYRMYKTGDLGSWNLDGTVQFYGRIDKQVKVRGYRIELGEIENKILQYQKVKTAAVVISDKGQDKEIDAFLVEREEFDNREIESFLAGLLPDYMIPARFIKVKELPLTQNGKIDYKKLDAISKEIAMGKKLELPETDTEIKLSEIWKQILNLDVIDVNDKFFNIGGHSLKATSMLRLVNKTFHIEIPLVVIFEKTSIKELAQYIDGEEKEEEIIIPRLEEKEYYEVSSAQKRIFLVCRLEEAELSFNTPYIFKLKGIVDIKRIEAVFNELIRRQEAFRTIFKIVDSDIVQEIVPSVKFEMKYYEETTGNKRKINKIIKNHIRKFELDKAPLMRAGMIKIQDDEYIMFFDMHHIISDGVSINIMVQEFCSLYEKRELPELKIQYKDYAEWHNKFLHSDKLKKQEEYWVNRFADGGTRLNLNLDYDRPRRQSFEGAISSFELNEEWTEKINALAKEMNLTLYMILLGGFNVLLHKYTQDHDITIGSPVAGRNYPDLENVIGVFINILCMRNQIESKMSFFDYMQEVKQNTQNAFANQDYQYEMLIEKLNLQRDLSRNPLFDVMFVLQNMDEKTFELEDFSVESTYLNEDTVQYDLKLEASEENNKILFHFEYATALFKEETIARYTEGFLKIIEQILDNKEILISDITVLTKNDKKCIEEINNTNIFYNKRMLVPQLFEQKVIQDETQIALVCEGESITYGELNKKANKVANMLLTLKVNKGEAVGLMINKSIKAIIGLLGIVKSGAVYVPLDPEYPVQRNKYIMEHSCVRTIITTSDMIKAFSSCNSLESVICLEGEYKKQDVNEKLCVYSMDDVKTQSDVNPEVSIAAEDIMYIIYTSGSTGSPKGVEVEHGNALNFMLWGIQKFEFNEHDHMMQVTSLSFDISLFEIFGALLSGAELHIIPLLSNIDDFVSYIIDNQISIWHSVPTLMKQVMLKIEDREEIFEKMNLRLIMLGGEAWSLSLAKLLKTIFKAADIVNMYGPTEATIWISSYEVEENMPYQSLPIGKPLANSKFYILDDAMHLCPIGVPGMIYLAGDNVARGYVNDKEKTNKVFLERTEYGRLYKTGDIGRYMKQGIEFLGRNDGMVKIRGYRIEVGEIEKVISEMEQIVEAVVVAKKEADTDNLYCFYTASKAIDETSIKEYANSKLPIYMIPCKFIQKEQFPLTDNKKINRKLLIEYIDNTAKDFVKPENGLEESILDVFCLVLEDKLIGVTDNFFERGGNSFLAIKLEVELEKRNIKISSNTVYEYSTVRGLAHYLQTTESEDNVQEVIPVKRVPEGLQEKQEGVLEGVEPFNEFYFQSCFYNAIFPVIRYYGSDLRSILVENIDLYRTNVTSKGEKILDIEYISCVPVDEILHTIGISIKMRPYTENVIEELKNTIDRGHFVIIWIDCYYESLKKKVYQTYHWPHSLLIYGYQEKQKEMFIIEHEYKDNLTYEKKKISYEELKRCYEGYKENFADQENMVMSYEIAKSGDAIVQEEQLGDRLYANLTVNKNQLAEQIGALEDFQSYFTDKAKKQSIKLEELEQIVEGLNHVINAKTVQMYTYKNVIPDNISYSESMNAILYKWKITRGILAKCIFLGECTREEIQKAMNYINDIVEEEKIFLNKIRKEKS